jgi:hypothetical protein
MRLVLGHAPPGNFLSFVCWSYWQLLLPSSQSGVECRALLTVATCGFALQTCFTDPGMLPKLSPSDQFLRNILPRYAPHLISALAIGSTQQMSAWQRMWLHQLLQCLHFRIFAFSLCIDCVTMHHALCMLLRALLLPVAPCLIVSPKSLFDSWCSSLHWCWRYHQALHTVSYTPSLASTGAVHWFTQSGIPY